MPPFPALSPAAAVGACAGMAAFYVAILYSPTLLLRLPPAASLNAFMLRRFACSLVSSAASVLAASYILGIRSFRDFELATSVFGVRGDHMWRALAFPILLTSLLYAGSFVSNALQFVSEWREGCYCGEDTIFSYKGLQMRIRLLATNVLAWRIYVMAPLTEELVFRACMIPLLLCAQLKVYSVIFLCPVFFSLAHLNNFLELYNQKGYSFVRASKVVGVQLGYTVIFGWYAAFLFIRTGNLMCPIVAHIVCNSMGLPIFYSSHSKAATVIASVGGCVGFFNLLFQATNPGLYNDVTDNCKCWHGYCNWG